MTSTTRRALAIVGLVASAGLVLGACSSDPEPTATTASLPADLGASGDASASTEAGTEVGDPTSPAGLACAAYFELDLLNSTYAGGAVQDGDLTEEEVKAKAAKLLKELVAQAQVAVSDGSADDKLIANSERMRKAIKELSKKENLSDLTAKQKELFVIQSSRVEKACARAGFDLPADNVTARTAAGL